MKTLKVACFSLVRVICYFVLLSPAKVFALTLQESAKFSEPTTIYSIPQVIGSKYFGILANSTSTTQSNLSLLVIDSEGKVVTKALISSFARTDKTVDRFENVRLLPLKNGHILVVYQIGNLGNDLYFVLLSSTGDQLASRHLFFDSTISGESWDKSSTIHVNESIESGKSKIVLVNAVGGGVYKIDFDIVRDSEQIKTIFKTGNSGDNGYFGNLTNGRSFFVTPTDNVFKSSNLVIFNSDDTQFEAYALGTRVMSYGFSQNLEPLHFSDGRMLFVGNETALELAGDGVLLSVHSPHLSAGYSNDFPMGNIAQLVLTDSKVILQGYGRIDGSAWAKGLVEYDLKTKVSSDLPIKNIEGSFCQLAYLTNDLIIYFDAGTIQIFDKSYKVQLEKSLQLYNEADFRNGFSTDKLGHLAIVTDKGSVLRIMQFSK